MTLSLDEIEPASAPLRPGLWQDGSVYVVRDFTLSGDTPCWAMFEKIPTVGVNDYAYVGSVRYLQDALEAVTDARIRRSVGIPADQAWDSYLPGYGQAVNDALANRNYGYPRDIVLETLPDLEDVRFDGYVGRFCEVARLIRDGRLFVQMESNIFGDEAPYLIVDGVSRSVLINDSYNSLHEDLEEWRTQTVPELELSEHIHGQSPYTPDWKYGTDTPEVEQSPKASLEPLMPFLAPDSFPDDLEVTGVDYVPQIGF
jgi:hypothetical protein